MDSWFYVSVVGFVLSALLWPYFLHRYRKASPVPLAEEASGLSEPERMEPARVLEPRPVHVVEAKLVESSQKLESVRQPASAPAPSGEAQTKADAVSTGVKRLTPVAVSPKPAQELRTGQTLTGGISPAVVYLQSMKSQLDRLEKDMRSLQGRVSDSVRRQESMVESILVKLGGAPPPGADRPGPEEPPLERSPGDAPSAGSANPGPGSGADAEPPPSPSGPEPEAVVQASPAAVFPDATIRLPPPVPVTGGEATPAPAAEEDHSERRGPVWPV